MDSRFYFVIDRGNSGHVTLSWTFSNPITASRMMWSIYLSTCFVHELTQAHDPFHVKLFFLRRNDCKPDFVFKPKFLKIQVKKEKYSSINIFHFGQEWYSKKVTYPSIFEKALFLHMTWNVIFFLNYVDIECSLIVLFKSVRNSKRRNKGNFTSKSNSNKIKLCGDGGQHYLVLNKISTL